MPCVIFWGQIHLTWNWNPVSACCSTEYVLLTALWIRILSDFWRLFPLLQQYHVNQRANIIQHFNFQLMHTMLKNVELLKYFKIRKTAPTCFGLQGNHHPVATVSTELKLHTWCKVDTWSLYKTLSVLRLHTVRRVCCAHIPHWSQYAVARALFNLNAHCRIVFVAG